MVLMVSMISLFPGYGEEKTVLNEPLKKYMDAYQEYLKAKINNDSSAAEKLEAYNQAYADYLAALKKGAILTPANSQVPEEKLPTATSTGSVSGGGGSQVLSETGPVPASMTPLVPEQK